MSGSSGALSLSLSLTVCEQQKKKQRRFINTVKKSVSCVVLFNLDPFFFLGGGGIFLYYNFFFKEFMFSKSVSSFFLFDHFCLFVMAIDLFSFVLGRHSTQTHTDTHTKMCFPLLDALRNRP